MGRQPRVALIGSRVPQGEVEPLLEGFEAMLFGAVEELPLTGGIPALIALWTGDDPLKAAIDDLLWLRSAMVEAPVVLVCSRMRPGDLRAALASGASGVVVEAELAATLGPTLRAAGAGQVCVPRSHSQQIEPASLTPREKQILGLVVMGYMNSQIAERLFVAESTVKSHLSSAFAKLGVRSRTEAAELIMDSERGLGMGILSLGSEPLEAIPNGNMERTASG